MAATRSAVLLYYRSYVSEPMVDNPSNRGHSDRRCRGSTFTTGDVGWKAESLSKNASGDVVPGSFFGKMYHHGFGSCFDGMDV